MKSKNIILDIKGSKSGHKRPHMHVPSGDCCRNHMVVVPGTGDRDFKFPPVQELVIRALNRLSKPVELEETDDNANPTEGSDGTDNGGDTGRGDALRPDEQEAHRRYHCKATRGRRSLPRKPAKVTVKYDHTFVPGLPTRRCRSRSASAASDRTGQGKRRYAVHRRAGVAARSWMKGVSTPSSPTVFDPLAGAVNWARLHMEERFQGRHREPEWAALAAARSSIRMRSRACLRFWLRRIPDVPEQMLLQVAVQVLDEELAQILTVLRIWTDAFAQHRRPDVRASSSVRFASWSKSATCFSAAMRLTATTNGKEGERSHDRLPGRQRLRGSLRASRSGLPCRRRVRLAHTRHRSAHGRAQHHHPDAAALRSRVPSRRLPRRGWSRGRRARSGGPKPSWKRTRRAS